MSSDIQVKMFRQPKPRQIPFATRERTILRTPSKVFSVIPSKTNVLHSPTCKSLIHTEHKVQKDKTFTTSSILRTPSNVLHSPTCKSLIHTERKVQKNKTFTTSSVISGGVALVSCAIFICLGICVCGVALGLLMFIIYSIFSIGKSLFDYLDDFAW